MQFVLGMQFFSLSWHNNVDGYHGPGECSTGYSDAIFDLLQVTTTRNDYADCPDTHIARLASL